MQDDAQVKSETLPFVSVIVPVYNAETMVGSCIESLLKQDYPRDRYEIIMVDNDSTDGTAGVIKQYPVRYLEERQVHTSYGARNTGAKGATGELLAFCDADQTAVPHWLRTLLRRWKDPNVGAFAGEVLPAPGAATFIGRYLANRESHYLNDWKNNRFGPTAGTGNVAFRAELFRQIGGFQENMLAGDLMMGWAVSNDFHKEIAYEEDAIMYHKPRATEDQLITREARNAYGRTEWCVHMKHRWYSLRLVARNARLAAVCTVAFIWRNIARGDDWRFRAYSAQMNARLAFAYLKGALACICLPRKQAEVRY
jgi:cellulose synthase/poly-beta-1,6-N-acetylglucosamine synthase-like glycosyltransferase